jgi:tRNA (guanosine-2'-O-)-methyltransferase
VRAEAVLAARRRDLTVVLEDAHDPHNISAVLRTCEAFGIQDVHIAVERGHAPSINDAITIGAERWLTLHRHAGAEAAIAALRARDYKIYVSHLSGESVTLPQLPVDVRSAYVFGNERDGVSPAWVENADARFVVPTRGFTGSLNLSVAVAVTIYERLSRARTPGDLSEEERRGLRAAWYAKLAHGSRELERTFESYLENPPDPELTFPWDRSR